MVHGVFSIFEGDKGYQKKSTQSVLGMNVLNLQNPSTQMLQVQRVIFFLSIRSVDSQIHFNKLVAYGSSAKLVWSVVQAVQIYQDWKITTINKQGGFLSAVLQGHSYQHKMRNNDNYTLAISCPCLKILY